MLVDELKEENEGFIQQTENTGDNIFFSCLVTKAITSFESGISFTSFESWDSS